MGLTRNELIMVAVLLSGTLLAVLNQTLLSPALPTIMASLSVDATTVQWLTSGYALVEAVVIPLSAFLIGRFTTRQLFITGIAIFTGGSLLAALAPSFPFLLAGRMLQALSTGIVMPMVMTVILLVFPREKRGSAMGIVGLIIGFAPAIGPSAAGVLVDSVGWRALFLIVTVLSVCVLIAGIAILKNYGDFARTTFDKLSVLLSSVGLLCLLYGLSTFTSSDNLAVTGALVLVGVVVLVLFVRRQLSLDVPMLKVSILKTRQYATTVIIVVGVQAALMGTGIITPLYIQGILGHSATVSGLVMLPGAVGGALLGLVAGRLFDRYGVRKVVIPGALAILVGAAGVALLQIDSSILFVAAVYTTISLSLQFTLTPINTWGLNSLSNDVLQHSQGLSNTMNQVAASFGTAMLVSISALGPHFAPNASAFEQSFFGDHLAFCTTAALLVVIVGIILVCVRDKKPATSKAGSSEVVTTPAAHRALAQDDLTVGFAMNKNPLYVSDRAAMRDVVLLMAQTETSGIPVVDDDYHIVGFVSDGDVASYLGKNEISLFDATGNLYRMTDDNQLAVRLANLLNLNVMKIATKRVLCTTPDTPLDEACHTLAEKRIKKMPVIEDGKLVGSLSRRNIIHGIASSAEELAAN